MPYRDRATVSAWIDDFTQTTMYETTVTVLEQDGASSADSGLVVVELRTAGTVTYIHPVVRERPTWIVTFEARDYDVDLDAGGVAKLLADVQTVYDLCNYLQQRTDDAVAAA